MSSSTYDQDIDKNVDWGGDTSTGGEPVSGRAVQKFIKDTLQSKIGYIYEDRSHNKCIGFADEGDYELWESDPTTYADLVVQEWYCYFPPAPVVLDYPAYYGTRDLPIALEAADAAMDTLSHTTSTSATCSSEKPYVYVALYNSYRLTRAMTENNENILSDFENIGTFTHESVTYKLLQFHSPSGMSLNVNINLSFSKS